MLAWTIYIFIHRRGDADAAKARAEKGCACPYPLERAGQPGNCFGGRVFNTSLGPELSPS